MTASTLRALEIGAVSLAALAFLLAAFAVIHMSRSL